MFNFWRKPQPEPTPQRPARSPQEYEALLRQLLERVEGNDGRANVQAFLIIQKVKSDELAEWLERFGAGLGEADAAEWGQPLEELGRLNYGRLSQVATGIARQLVPLGMPKAATVNRSRTATGQGALQGEAADAWFSRGNQQYMLGDFVGAIASYDQVLQSKPDYHQAWVDRGLSLFALGRNEEAIASYDQALQIKSDYHQA